MLPYLLSAELADCERVKLKVNMPAFAEQAAWNEGTLCRRIIHDEAGT